MFVFNLFIGFGYLFVVVVVSFARFAVLPFLLHVLLFLSCLCKPKSTSNQQKPTRTYKTRKSLQKPAKTQKSKQKTTNKRKNLQIQQTPTQVSNTLAVPCCAEGSQVCTVSLRMSGHPAIWGEGQKARLKAIEGSWGVSLSFLFCASGGNLLTLLLLVLYLLCVCCFLHAFVAISTILGRKRNLAS